MFPSDQIQDLFDHALSSVPDQPVPSPRALHERLSRRRVRTRFSAFRAVALFRRARQSREYSGRLYPTLVVAAVAVVALVAGLVVVGAKNSPRTTSPTTSPGALSFRLMDMSANPFRSLSPGATVSLQCVTDLVCYSPNAQQDGLYRTTDGGLSWEETAPFPLEADEQIWVFSSFSCATVETCAIVETPVGTGNEGQFAEFILTTDGGAQWSMSPILAPTGLQSPSLDRIACGDASHCVVSVNGNAPVASGASPNSSPPRIGTFFSTANAGQTWLQATTPPNGSAAGVSAMNCDAEGSCVAISAVYSNPNLSVDSIRSDDWGLTWQVGASAVYDGDAILFASCGTTTNCMAVVGNTTASYEIETTSNAGVTWNASGAPAGWGNMATAMSCANANDCWIATSTYDAQSPEGDYSHPAIEATYDGGTTWSWVGLPTVAPPIGDVVTLSCPPSGDGCMGIGNLRDHFLPPSNSVPPSRPPAQPQSGPLVISNLPGAN